MSSSSAFVVCFAPSKRPQPPALVLCDFLVPAEIFLLRKVCRGMKMVCDWLKSAKYLHRRVEEHLRNWLGVPRWIRLRSTMETLRDQGIASMLSGSTVLWALSCPLPHRKEKRKPRKKRHRFRLDWQGHRIRSPDTKINPIIQYPAMGPGPAHDAHDAHDPSGGGDASQRRRGGTRDAEDGQAHANWWMGYPVYPDLDTKWTPQDIDLLVGVPSGPGSKFRSFDLKPYGFLDAWRWDSARHEYPTVPTGCATAFRLRQYKFPDAVFPVEASVLAVNVGGSPREALLQHIQQYDMDLVKSYWSIDGFCCYHSDQVGSGITSNRRHERCRTRISEIKRIRVDNKANEAKGFPISLAGTDDDKLESKISALLDLVRCCHRRNNKYEARGFRVVHSHALSFPDPIQAHSNLTRTSRAELGHSQPSRESQDAISCICECLFSL